MSKAKPTCKVCGIELNKENWYPSYRKSSQYVCKACDKERTRLWKKANPKKVRTQCTRWSRKQGIRPFNENKECSLFLGVHIAERVLSHVFKDVERMPNGNRGFDFICNKGRLIDVKSACLKKNGKGWHFHIKRNTTADYFLCLAFDNREDLNPLHAWILPGDKFNHLISATIHPDRVYRWNKFALDIDNVVTCCNTMKD